MIVKTNFTCPICGSSKDIIFGKPKFFQSVVVRVNCGNCLTKFLDTVSLVPGDRAIYRHDIKADELSEKGMKILMEKHPEKFSKAKITVNGEEPNEDIPKI